MLKLTILLLMTLIIVLTLFWPTVRRRLKRGFRVGVILYAALTVARLSQAQTDQETLLDLAVIVGLFGGFWLLVWVATNLMLARRRTR